MPAKHLGTWMMFVWDCETKRRDLLTFREIDFTETHWDLFRKLDTEMSKNTHKYNLKQGKGKWVSGGSQIEAWSSIGELIEDVSPHARVLAMMHYLMMSRSTVSDVVRNMPMRDIEHLRVEKSENNLTVDAVKHRRGTDGVPTQDQQYRQGHP
jgi:hypothetical protein